MKSELRALSLVRQVLYHLSQASSQSYRTKEGSEIEKSNFTLQNRKAFKNVSKGFSQT
jgi:hypothetical protein